MRIDEVARAPYALTLWAYLQREESKRLDMYMREEARIDLAQLVTVGHIKGTGPMISRRQELIQRYSAPIEERTLDQISQEADDLWAQHNRSTKNRPVS